MNNIHSKSPIDMGLFHRIDINLYPLFIAIYEQKSISKAAQILSITQSAASHALQRLRSHLRMIYLFALAAKCFQHLLQNKII